MNYPSNAPLTPTYSKSARTSHIVQESLTESVAWIMKEARQRFDPSRGPAQGEGQLVDVKQPWQGINIPHVQALNPFDHYPASIFQPCLDAFVQRVNSIFFFFNEEDLEQRFRIVSERSAGLPNGEMSELCLILALGAQMRTGGNDDGTIMWYENGRRYLDDQNWCNELWLMRATALISLFHLEQRPDTSRHYLGRLAR